MIQLCKKLSKGDTTKNVVTKTTLSLYVNFSPFLGAYLLLLIVRSIFKGDFRQLLGEIFVVSVIIKVEVTVISRAAGQG